MEFQVNVTPVLRLPRCCENWNYLFVMECYIDLLFFYYNQLTSSQFANFLGRAGAVFSFRVGMVLLAQTGRCYSYSVCLLAVLSWIPPLARFFLYFYN